MGIGICAVAVIAIFALIATMGVASAYADYSAGQGELGTMSTKLSAGDTFKKDGNKYEVLKTAPLSDNSQGTVELVRYGSKDKKPVINKVMYKGNRYEVRIIV